MSLLREESPASALKTLCGLFGYSRQSYYNRDSDNEFAENAIEPLIVEKASDYRKDNPGLGCAKLYLIINGLFESTGCMPGRDAFIELLRKKRTDGSDKAASSLQDHRLHPSLPQI